jgi:FlaA1/EpsC-like NDP-sugar epimerase
LSNKLFNIILQKQYKVIEIIYGTDANAISVAKALKLESPLRFKIVAFIDRNGQNSSKRMLDLPILILKKNFLL